MDFTCVFDAKGIQLFIFAVIEFPSRRLIIINSTTNPTREWLTQQFRNCCVSGHQFPDAMVHDRDGVYGQWLPDLLKEFECKSVKTPPRCPWENPFIERFFGGFKREMLDRVKVIDSDHARELSLDYQSYFNQDRPHQGIGGKIPEQLDRAHGNCPDINNLRFRKIRKLNGLVTQFELAAVA